MRCGFCKVVPHGRYHNPCCKGYKLVCKTILRQNNEKAKNMYLSSGKDTNVLEIKKLFWSHNSDEKYLNPSMFTLRPQIT